jgi:phosphodiesterase/alkaline phosphatase D-like protein
MANEVFRHGVASGDPTDERVVLWTRVTVPGDDPVPVRWRVAVDPHFRHVVAEGDASADPQRDHCVSVDAGGLRPATTYWYDFHGADERSTVGRTRTLPGHGASGLRFAFTSCAKFNAGYFNAYDRLADRDDIDVVLHLGDYIYEASNTPPASQTPGADIGRPFSPLHECVSLDDYRTRYAQYAMDPSVQRLRAAHPVIGCVDDHELADGAWRESAAEHLPEYGTWGHRVEAAFRAREEWLPIRRPDPADPTRTHRCVAVGDLADLVVLDTRSRRDQPVAGDAMHDPSRSALGADQRAWLFDTLQDSTARWRLLANPSVLSTTWHPQLPDDAELATALLKLKLVDPAGSGAIDHDQWEGYPAERTELLDTLAGLDDVVVLSGDIHVGMANEVRRDPWAADDPAVAVELITPSVTSQNLDDKLGYPAGGSRAVAERFVDAFPHVRWADFDGHGYVLVDLDREQLRASWWCVDDVLRPVDGERCVARFTVKRGSAELVES